MECLLKGTGCLRRVTEMMEKLRMHRPMIVGTEPLLSMLMEAVPVLTEVPVFRDFHPNPDFQDCEAGKRCYLENACDGMISIGGGSSMDTAKGIKALLLGGTVERVLEGTLSDEETVPVIAIPGTAGTGAEATQFAVLYIDGRKISLNHPALLAEGVLLDGELLTSLPDYHKKSCAMDALAQGIESIWARGATGESREHAAAAIRGILAHLKAYLEGDGQAAQAMLEASFESGRAIQISKTTAAHAMSYQLTKMLGYAHGHACMLTLPWLWKNMEGREEVAEILKELNRTMETDDGAELLLRYLTELGLEPTRKPDEAMMDLLAASVNTERLGNHPVPLEQEELKHIYRQAFAMAAERHL